MRQCPACGAQSSDKSFKFIQEPPNKLFAICPVCSKKSELAKDGFRRPWPFGQVLPLL